MQGILELDIVSGSGVGHGTPDFDAQSERSNYGRESQSTVAGPPSCASVALRRKLGASKEYSLMQCIDSVTQGIHTITTKLYLAVALPRPTYGC